MQAHVIALTPVRGITELSYEIPAAIEPHLRPGHRVLVPMRSRKLTAIVLRIDDSRPAAGELKPVLEVLEPQPLLDEAHLKLIEFIASYYMVSLAEVYRAVMPGAMRVESRQLYALAAKPDPLMEATMSPAARAIIAALGKAPRMLRQLERIANGEAAGIVRGLLAQGLVARREALAGRHRAGTELFVRLCVNAGTDGAAVRGARQRALLAELSACGPEGLNLTYLERQRAGAKAAAQALASRGIVELVEENASQASDDFIEVPAALPVLSEEQQTAVRAVAAVLERRAFESFLLWGITASGKTEVYLQLVARCLEAGRQALVMVPEIALTDHLVRAFRGRFGAEVVVAHSGQNIGERWAALSAARTGHARVVLGPRSALFAPLSDLGLIVVDEEHDPAYKQEEGIRYHARDLAVVLARLSSCPIVLGSATPSAESFMNARQGRYRLLQLRRRIGDRPLAEVEVVDLRREQSAPATQNGQEREAGPPPVPLSKSLVAALTDNLAQGGQSLVFINRRGYHNFLNCRLCGAVLSCPDCSVTLTFHLRDHSLRCHYCGFYRAAPEACPECRGLGLQGQGFGTERLHSTLERILPQARIERMDSDTSRRRGLRYQILRALAAGEVDILVGTQMITKGFDFPGVTLVAVVVADMSLNLPDFRSAERTFQLLTQAAGRAGRGEAPGKVVIQTYAPHHYAIRAAQHQDYARFIRRELELRRELDYPPYARLAMVRLEGEQPAAVERIAQRTADALSRASAGARLRVLGPAPAPIERLRQRYRWQVMLKGAERAAMREALLTARAEVLPIAEQARVYFAIDIDPVHML